MDLKACDRCGKQFRISKSNEETTTVTPLATDGAPPKLPRGLHSLNEVTLPLIAKDVGPNKEQAYLMVDLDACSECVKDLVPMVQQWMKKEKKSGEMI